MESCSHVLEPQNHTCILALFMICKYTTNVRGANIANEEDYKTQMFICRIYLLRDVAYIKLQNIQRSIVDTYCGIWFAWTHTYMQTEYHLVIQCTKIAVGEWNPRDVTGGKDLFSSFSVFEWFFLFCSLIQILVFYYFTLHSEYICSMRKWICSCMLRWKNRFRICAAEQRNSYCPVTRIICSKWFGGGQK